MSLPSSPDDRSAIDTEEGQQTVRFWAADTRISDTTSTPFDDDDDDVVISQLVDSEADFLPSPDYLPRFRDRSVHVTSRQDSINWILKVNAHYRFSPVTAFLSVNYFDRFLSSRSLPASGWPFQLLSVACLSLAAKLEEPQVPLLLDLQVLEPGFVFEPVNVQRMELRVMAGLDWRLGSVTPFDYLAYFISRLPPVPTSIGADGFFNRVLLASSDLILRTTRVIDFLAFPPSTVAAATVLSAAGVSIDAMLYNGWSFHGKVNREMVRSCHQLVEEYLVDTCPSAGLVDLAATAPPQPAVAPTSPVGVLDAAACGSCDTRSGNPASSSQAGAEPPSKRPRSSAPNV